MKIKSIEVIDGEETKVYDAEVEVEHAFICEGVVLHNSPYCRAADGKRYDKNYKPIGHNFTIIAPNQHWRCRSTMLPITKTWAQLSGPNSKLSKKQLGTIERSTTQVTRAMIGKPIKGRVFYNTWLKKQSKNVQEEVLGVKKRELWLENKITLPDMVDQTGRELTIPELEELIKDRE